MEPESEPKRRRPNVIGRAARTKRIFGRLRDGWAYDEIGRDEGLSAERIRQIVSEVLGKRVIDRNEDHAHLQLERLGPALRLAGKAIQRGEVKAIGVLDRRQVVFVSKYYYGDEGREKLHAKINRIAANLKNEDPPEGTDAAQAAAADAASQGGKANEFFIGRNSQAVLALRSRAKRGVSKSLPRAMRRDAQGGANEAASRTILRDAMLRIAPSGRGWSHMDPCLAVVFFAASACKALISPVSRSGIAIFCNFLQLSEGLKGRRNVAFGKLLQQIARVAPACVRERRPFRTSLGSVTDVTPNINCY